MQKKIKFFVIFNFLLFFSFSVIAKSEKGVVAYTISGCDYFVVETLMGYTLCEWYGGALPDEDDLLYGEFEEYGYQVIYNATKGDKMTIWVEEYWLSKDEALEKLIENCE